MKKILLVAALFAAMASCSKDDMENSGNGSTDTTTTPTDTTTTPTDTTTSTLVTFEDATGDYWASKIDTAQYGGKLLYGELADTADAYSFLGSGYSWEDSETKLYSAITESWGSTAYWNGGIAISNYTDIDFAGAGFDRQLEINTKGNNGSANYAVVGMGGAAKLSFADSTAKKIESIYVAATNYQRASADTSSYCAFADSSFIKLTAYGLGENQDTVATSEFFLAKDGAFLDGWNKWDLSSLGFVYGVAFGIAGDQNNKYGMLQPQYFAMDDVLVVEKVVE